VSAVSQRFSKKIKQESQENLNTLIAMLDYIDKKQELTRSDNRLMLQIRQEISTIYKNTAAEKRDFLQSQVIQEANTQSKFVLRINKQSKPSTVIDQLKWFGRFRAKSNE